MCFCFKRSKKNKIISMQQEETYQNVLNYSRTLLIHPSTNKECWICLEEEGYMHRVCKCNMYVHIDCLDRWRNMKQDLYKCNICNFTYEYKQNKCKIPIYLDDKYLGYIKINKSSNDIYNDYMNELSKLMLKYIDITIKLSEYDILLQNIFYVCDEGNTIFTGIKSFNEAIFQNLQYIKFKSQETMNTTPMIKNTNPQSLL